MRRDDGVLSFIERIEKGFDVESIRTDGIQLWPFLRKFYFYAFSKVCRQPGGRSYTARKLRTLFNIFQNLSALFRRYDSLVFSSGAISLVRVRDRYCDKYCEGIYERYAPKALYIESGSEAGHRRKGETAGRRFLSGDLVILLARVLTIGGVQIEGEDVLQKMEKACGIAVDYRRYARDLLGYLKVLQFIIACTRPRIIFLSCYYCRYHPAVVFAAHRAGIPVVEVQHGIINKKHPAYNVFANVDTAFFPDYLLTFGEYVRDVFDEGNRFIDRQKVIPIGSMYLDYINYEYRASREVEELFESFRERHDRVVAVSSQDRVEEKLLAFLERAAGLDSRILYIFVPRNLKRRDYSTLPFPENIVVVGELNVYQIIREADFHSTVYSTCALEAPALGVPNILIDIDDLASLHYGEILKDRETSRYVGSAEQYVRVIRTWKKKSKEDIIDKHRRFFQPDYRGSLEKALLTIESSLKRYDF
jgi:hypothetical protein